jgi:hypothetical protein
MKSAPSDSSEIVVNKSREIVVNKIFSLWVRTVAADVGRQPICPFPPGEKPEKIVEREPQLILKRRESY